MDTNSTYKQKVGEAAGMTEHERSVRRGFTSEEVGSKLPKFLVTITEAPNSLNLTRCKFDFFVLSFKINEKRMPAECHQSKNKEDAVWLRNDILLK